MPIVRQVLMQTCVAAAGDRIVAAEPSDAAADLHDAPGRANAVAAAPAASAASSVPRLRLVAAGHVAATQVGCVICCAPPYMLAP